MPRSSLQQFIAILQQFITNDIKSWQFTQIYNHFNRKHTAILIVSYLSCHEHLFESNCICLITSNCDFVYLLVICFNSTYFCLIVYLYLVRKIEWFSIYAFLGPAGPGPLSLGNIDAKIQPSAVHNNCMTICVAICVAASQQHDQTDTKHIQTIIQIIYKKMESSLNQGGFFCVAPLDGLGLSLKP